VRAPVLQVRVPEGTLGRLDGTRGEETRSAWALRLIDRELAGQPTAPAPASPFLAALTDGEPSPGCLELSIACYGLGRLPSAMPAPPRSATS
jgi:hypothetical protein